MHAVADTSNTAAISKRCAAQLGYVDDPFACWFDRSHTRCAPIINRGTFVRVAAIDAVCDQFAPPARAPGDDDLGAVERQILSLGAGLDTRAWRMRHAGCRLARYVEVDLPAVCDRKLHVLRGQRARDARGASAAPAADDAEGAACLLASRADALVSADLSNLDSLRAALLEARFDPRLPTLVLIECVLVYMAPDAGSALLRFLAGYLSDAACLAYEMIRPDDAFGRQMRANLEARGLRIPGIDGCTDTRAHEARFAQCGWSGCRAVDMLHWYEHVLPRAERQRVERVEWLDELEEWKLLLSHYCFVLAALPHEVGAHSGWAAGLDWATARPAIGADVAPPPPPRAAAPPATSIAASCGRSANDRPDRAPLPTNESASERE
ncbi:hypothetical protein KFE25_000410 [Diacronema lutheri]|uniref:Leucine carboxyl methyltransferase 1 n=1 Tax=Diacronema lutheri TaxID=2081491 RepID=A0A8J6CC18_DIALT|nr:hypothetical protein KFE25_000410 [Diacronema lutheri]